MTKNSEPTKYSFWDDEVAVQRMYGNPPDLNRYNRKPSLWKQIKDAFGWLMGWLKSILSPK